MKLSIIIPVYQVEKYVKKCVSSLLIPNRNDYELIIINDGTKDRSIEIVEQSFSDSRIRIIHQKNAGLSAARNRGIRAAKGLYFWVFDSDDWAETNCISEILDLLDGKTDVFCFKSHFCNYEDNGRQETINDMIKGTTGKDVIGSQYEPCTPYFIYKRSVITDNNLYFTEGITHEDSLFTPIALFHCERVGYYCNPVYHHLMRDGSITHVVRPKRITDLIFVVRKLLDYGDSLGRYKYKWTRCITTTAYGMFFIQKMCDDRDVEYKLKCYVNCNWKLIRYFFYSKNLKDKCLACLSYIMLGNVFRAYRILYCLQYRKK